VIRVLNETRDALAELRQRVLKLGEHL